jgi:6-hydroxycyclohex-1-ene-1-carbonyl-CoA dehydrogenase
MTKVGEPLRRVSFELSPPAPGEVIVEVAGCGVCHTDLGYYYDGVATVHELPLALGHEISGRIAAVGAGVDLKAGQAVLVYSVIPCGDCDLCRRGLSQICRRQQMPGNHIQGGFASHIKIPANGFCIVDEARLARTGLGLADISVIADAVTTPYQAVVNAGIGPGDLAVVIGVGGVGGYAVQIAHALGATVVAVDVDPVKLDMISQYGASQTFNARDISGRDLKKAVAGFARERGLKATEWAIFECSGNTAGQKTAFGLLTFGATLCVVGFTPDEVPLRLSNLMAFNARAIGNWGCNTIHYPAVLDLVLAGKLKLMPFIERFPLSDIAKVFDAVHGQRQTRRPILIPN